MTFFPLPRYATLELTGVDRIRFLQGQLTQDVARLDAAGVLRAAILNPAGRVLALAWLIEREESVVLVVPDELAASLAERLRRYVLRAKVRIALPGEALAIAGRASAPGEQPPGGARHQRLADGASLLTLPAGGLLLAPAASLAQHLATDDGAGAAAWEGAEVAAGEPGVLAATAELFTAQMLNLDLLEAISFTKGCYTGQEIVARTQHLGRIKRRMFRYRSDEPVSVAPGEALNLHGAKVGEVVRAASEPAATEILAVVSLEARDQPLASGRGVRFAPLALPYPIA